MFLHFFLIELSDVIFNNAIYTDDTSLYFKCDKAYDLQKQLELVSKLKSKRG